MTLVQENAVKEKLLELNLLDKFEDQTLSQTTLLKILFANVDREFNAQPRSKVRYLLTKVTGAPIRLSDITKAR